MTAVHGQSMRVVFAFKINASRDAARLRNYWRPKLAYAATGAFEVDALFPDTDGVFLDYRSYDGSPVRTHFRFTDDGKIGHTACAPIGKAA